MIHLAASEKWRADLLGKNEADDAYPTDVEAAEQGSSRFRSFREPTAPQSLQRRSVTRAAGKAIW